MIEPLMHFSDEVVARVRSVEPRGRHLIEGDDKPEGFWISDEGSDDSWSAWCKAENYGLGAIPHVISLSPAAKILRLSSLEELDAFTDKYACAPTLRDYPDAIYHIDWRRVGEKHQGILISPYQWAYRLSRRHCWYYTWDCASGCIWDASAIAEIMAIPVPETISVNSSVTP